METIYIIVQLPVSTVSYTKTRTSDRSAWLSLCQEVATWSCVLASNGGLLLLLLGLLFGVAFALSADRNHSVQACQQECPTWLVLHYNNSTMSCVCGDTKGRRVLCEQNSNASEYCMTYDEVNDSIALKSCPYHYHKPDVQGLYVTLSQNVCDLNEFMCGGLNRTGLLCSNCKPGLGPSVFSHTLPYLKCLDSGYGWLLFMFLQPFRLL